MVPSAAVDDGGGGGGGDDAPSAKEFCGALKDFQDDFTDATATKDLTGYIKTLKDGAEKLEDLGGADEDTPEDAQEASTARSRRSRTSPDYATLDDLAQIDEVSEDDPKKLDALQDVHLQEVPRHLTGRRTPTAGAERTRSASVRTHVAAGRSR